jgi:ribosomal protein S12 methylthiotransferase accessory factor
MDFQVHFPGGKKIDVQVGPHLVKTDQPVQGGGEGSAPTPFDTFLASFGACAGIYVVGFCQARGIPTEGITLVQRNEYDAAAHRLARIRLELTLPPSFPEKYRDAVRRAAESCAVKKALADPPEVVVETTAG